METISALCMSPIDHGEHASSAGEDLAPFGEGAIGRNDRTFPLVAAADQLDRQVGVAIGVGQIADFVYFCGAQHWCPARCTKSPRKSLRYKDFRKPVAEKILNWRRLSPMMTGGGFGHEHRQDTIRADHGFFCPSSGL
jgi:hypothetical protein